MRSAANNRNKELTDEIDHTFIKQQKKAVVWVSWGKPFTIDDTMTSSEDAATMQGIRLGNNDFHQDYIIHLVEG